MLLLCQKTNNKCDDEITEKINNFEKHRDHGVIYINVTSVIMNSPKELSEGTKKYC